MEVTLKINCSHRQLQQALADWCDRWARDEKPDDWDLDESNSQRALERGSEGEADGVNGEDAISFNPRGPSNSIVTSLANKVKETTC